jgi:hypothetical protein
MMVAVQGPDFWPSPYTYITLIGLVMMLIVETGTGCFGNYLYGFMFLRRNW